MVLGPESFQMKPLGLRSCSTPSFHVQGARILSVASKTAGLKCKDAFSAVCLMGAALAHLFRSTSAIQVAAQSSSLFVLPLQSSFHALLAPSGRLPFSAQDRFAHGQS